MSIQMKKGVSMLLLVFGFVVSGYSQVPEEDEPKPGSQIKPKPIAKPKVVPVTLNFQGDHDFYLAINGVKHGKVLKGQLKSVKLNPDIYRFTFEEADSTGEYIEQMFRVTKGMTKQKDSIYKIAFKEDYQQIMNKFSGTPTVQRLPSPTMSEEEKKIFDMLNLIEKTMVLIEGGSFTMGDGEAKDEQSHTVLVSDVRFAKYEVTQQLWKDIMGYNRSNRAGCNECPVENVSWNEVDTFIRKINRISGKQFRLPTEAEWEYVARKSIEGKLDGATNPKAFAKKWVALLNEVAWYSGNARKKTEMVGKKQGLLEINDLLGNVAEWCSDFYQADYQNDQQQNPRGPANGSRRVIKGGSYQDDENTIRIASRDSEAPDKSRKTVGFRLVMDNNKVF